MPVNVIDIDFRVFYLLCEKEKFRRCLSQKEKTETPVYWFGYGFYYYY